MPPSEIIIKVSIDELLLMLRQIVQEELNNASQKDYDERLISPKEACKIFSPPISLVTLARWTKDGLLNCQRIGGRLFYKKSELIESVSKVKRYKR